MDHCAAYTVEVIISKGSPKDIAIGRVCEE